jgi:hypothetical protein
MCLFLALGGYQHFYSTGAKGLDASSESASTLYRIFGSPVLREQLLQRNGFGTVDPGLLQSVERQFPASLRSLPR